jgi:hypothetical protein
MKYLTKKRIIIGIVIVFLVWASSGIYLYTNFDTSDRSSIGDMFGAINALFSGVALFGIILSIFLQQNSLELQQEEIKLTRDEFKHSRLTNILFKTVDYINNRIRTFQFQGISIIGANTNNSVELLGIEKFSNFIKSHLYKLNSTLSDDNIKLDSYQKIEIYTSEIFIILKDILNSIEAFDQVLQLTSLNTDVKKELIILFKNSLDKNAYEMLKSIIELPISNLSHNDFVSNKNYDKHQILIAQLESLRNLASHIIKKLG